MASVEHPKRRDCTPRLWRAKGVCTEDAILVLYPGVRMREREQLARILAYYYNLLQRTLHDTFDPPQGLHVWGRC